MGGFKLRTLNCSCLLILAVCVVACIPSAIANTFHCDISSEFHSNISR